MHNIKPQWTDAHSGARPQVHVDEQLTK